MNRLNLRRILSRVAGKTPGPKVISKKGAQNGGGSGHTPESLAPLAKLHHVVIFFGARTTFVTCIRSVRESAE